MAGGYIDFEQPSLKLAAVSIIFNPLFWNFAARQEYHNKTITKLAGGNARLGCYLLAGTIFSLGIFRDYLFREAIERQPSINLLLSPPVSALAVTCFITGNVLVATSMWTLGVTGTYLGDYFGILMDEMVTGFPFNITTHPMYNGSVLSFIGTSLWYGKPAGVCLSLLVWVMYQLACLYEEPFTTMIYQKRDQQRKSKGIKSK